MRLYLVVLFGGGLGVEFLRCTSLRTGSTSRVVDTSKRTPDRKDAQQLRLLCSLLMWGQLDRCLPLLLHQTRLAPDQLDGTQGVQRLKKKPSCGPSIVQRPLRKCEPYLDLAEGFK